MKKRGLIGIAVVVGVLTLAGTALAKPTESVRPLPAAGSLEQGLNQRFTASQPVQKIGMTKAEYDALMARSEFLNRKYGVGIEGLTLERGSSDRFAPGNQTKHQLVAFTPTDTSTGFAWDNAGIGAGALVALAVVGTGLVALRHRSHGPLGTS
jgi:hypothetical protein